MLSYQEQFMNIMVPLLKQGVGSKKGDGCFYRGPDGLKCAVGQIIPDAMYDLSLEGQSARDVKVAPILEKLGYSILLCIQLQEIHDTEEPETWLSDSVAVARNLGIGLSKEDYLALDEANKIGQQKREACTS